MKKIVFAIFGLLLVFIGLTYWSVSNAPSKFQTCEILGLGDIDQIDFREYDSVLVAANTLYEGNVIKHTMQGKQYREAWTTPVKVPIVFLDTLMGGMQVVKEGGGKQTHSLEIEAADGTVFTLRGIAKDPEPLVPEVAEELGLENIVIDGVSAQHPYSAIVVAAMAERAGLLHTRPRTIFVPKQPALKGYNAKYGNRLFLLEYETEGKAYWTGLENATKIVDTERLQELKQKHPEKLSIDKATLIRARLFDLLIGDWDRHAKQWGWVITESGGDLLAIPLPCDRDNAFFNLEGVIPTLISNKNFLPGVQPFENSVQYLEGLVGPFDLYFLREVPEQIFLDQAKTLQDALTDSIISEAFKIWPENIYDLNGSEIISKISHRRKDLPRYAKQFHRILNERDPLSEPLNGSEDLQLDTMSLACFDCKLTASE